MPAPMTDGCSGHMVVQRARLTCATPTFCLRLVMAVDPVAFGGPKNTLQRWDGTAWTPAASPITVRAGGSYDGQQGRDVDCPAADACVLTGEGSTGWVSGPLVARGNGTSWAAWQALPRVPGQSGPTGQAVTAGAVSCGAVDRCLVAGETGLGEPTASAWFGPPWAAIRSAAQPAGWRVRTSAVSCLPVGGFCLVVGHREQDATRLPVAYTVPVPVPVAAGP